MTANLTINQKMAEAFLRVNNELKDESDRGAVIVSCAWMDEELTRALKAFCVPSLRASDKDDELFGMRRPVGDAAAKIDLAFRLSLIREETYKSLHLVRKLRNDFAHLSSRLTFKTDSVRDRIRTLFELQSCMTDAILTCVSEHSEVADVLQLHAGKSSPAALEAVVGSRALFDLLAGTIVAGLMLLTDEIPCVDSILVRRNTT